MQNIDCWIFIGGEHPNIQVVQNLATVAVIIAADSGCRSALDLGYTPDYVVGDFDSLDLTVVQELIPEDRIITAPRDKDLSDTELALELANKLGLHKVILLGGGGGRVDHLLAIIKIFNAPFKPVEWITASERIFLIEGEAILDEKEGTTISFFPMQQVPKKVSSEGLVWELNNVKWRDGSFSLSNRVHKSPAKINCEGGKMLAIIPNSWVL